MGISKGLTDAQYLLARLIERAGITSYSQVVKAFKHKDTASIKEWRKQLAKEVEKAEKA